MSHDARARLSDLRRMFHRHHPGPGWREFQTTARVVEELERIGVDEIAVGREALATDARMAVPDDDEIQPWLDRARRAGVSDDLLERTAGVATGVVATLSQGGAVYRAARRSRRDLDSRIGGTRPPAGPRRRGSARNTTGTCTPAATTRTSRSHSGTLEAVKQSAFEGTLKVLFQPAEEISGGGKAMAESGHLDGVDYLFALHVGLDHPTGDRRRRRGEPAGDGT